MAIWKIPFAGRYIIKGNSVRRAQQSASARRSSNLRRTSKKPPVDMEYRQRLDAKYDFPQTKSTQTIRIPSSGVAVDDGQRKGVVRTARNIIKDQLSSGVVRRSLQRKTAGGKLKLRLTAQKMTVRNALSPREGWATLVERAYTPSAYIRYKQAQGFRHAAKRSLKKIPLLSKLTRRKETVQEPQTPKTETTCKPRPARRLTHKSGGGTAGSQRRVRFIPWCTTQKG